MSTTLDEADKQPLEFAQQSYKKAEERENVGDYEYDPTLSDVNTAVWHDHKTKKTHVSNRGSVSAYDWGVSDMQIATGMEHRGSRFKKAVDVTNKAHDKYGYNVSTCGHSLGAKTSAYTTEKLGDQDWYEGGTGFNQGNSSLGRDNYFSKQRRACRRKTNRPKYCDKQTNIKEKGDYVSQHNIGCAILTFGMGGKLCTKGDAFGTTKRYDHRKNRRWTTALSRSLFPSIKVFGNAKTHSLHNFK